MTLAAVRLLTFGTILLVTSQVAADETPDVRKVLAEAIEQAKMDQFRGSNLKGIPELLARAGDVAGALDIAQSTIMVGEQVGRVAIAQAKAGDWNGAFRTVDSIGDDRFRERALGQLVGVQADQGDFQAARTTAEKLTDTNEKGFAIAQIASAQAKRGQIEGALETAKALPEKGWVAHDIALAQAKAGQLDAALRTVADIRPDTYRAETLAQIAEHQVQSGDPVGTKRVLKQAEDTLGTNWSSRNHGLAGRKIAAVQMKLGDRDQARATFRKAMQATDEKNQRLVVWEQAKAGDVSEAIQTAKAMHLVGGLESIALVQAESGDFTGALATAELIGSAEIRSTALALVAAAQRKAGRLADAKIGFQRAVETAHQETAVWPNDPTARAVYWIAYEQAKCGDAQTAVEWARKEQTSQRCSRALVGAAKGILDRKEAAGRRP